MSEISIKNLNNNINNTSSNNGTKKNDKTESKITKALQSRTLTGGLFGVGIGVGDSIATSYCSKKNIAKFEKEYKPLSFKDKRNIINNLHKHNFTTKSYKAFISKIKNSSTGSMIARRSLLYGGLAATTGMAIDLYKNNTKK